MSIPERIRVAMKSRSWQQKDLAHALSISEQYVSDILAGRRSISVYVALGIERVLGIDAEALLIQQVREELAEARKVSA